MAVCSIVRVTGIVKDGKHVPDITWRTLWTMIEVCIAVAMGSLMAMRTLFVGSSYQQQQYHRNLRKLPEGSGNHLSVPSSGKIGNRQSKALPQPPKPPSQASSRNTEKAAGEQIELPSLPSPMFFQGRFSPGPPPLETRHPQDPRRTLRGSPRRTVFSATESDFDPSEGDYHSAIRDQGGMKGAWLRTGQTTLH